MPRTARKPPKVLQNTGSPLERHLETSLLAAGVVGWEREVVFHPTRRWRIDFCFRVQRLAVEIEGGIYHSGGGHSSVAGIKRDIAKHNQLMLLGWRLLRVHGDQVRSGEAVELIRQALGVPTETGGQL